MRKLAEVEEAKELMTEALEWSVFTWLWQKANVRGAADQANTALDELEKTVKARWPEDLKAANKELQTQARDSAKGRRLRSGAEELIRVDPEIKGFLEKVKRAEQTAHRARMDAERTFDEAERLLSTIMAKEGCGKAIRSWELYEEAIRLAEGAIPSKTAK